MDEIDEKLARLPADLARRIKAHVYEEGDCLIWTGTCSHVTPLLWLPKPGAEGNSRSVRRVIAEHLSLKGKKNTNATARCGNLSAHADALGFQPQIAPARTHHLGRSTADPALPDQAVALFDRPLADRICQPVWQCVGQFDHPRAHLSQAHRAA